MARVTFHRVTYISPLHVGAIQTVTCVAGYLLGCAVSAFTWYGVGVAIAAGAGFFGGVLAAIVFDLVAPWFGGVRVRFVEEPAPDPGTRKPCPKCGAQVRSDRSFCPECDFSFPDAL